MNIKKLNTTAIIFGIMAFFVGLSPGSAKAQLGCPYGGHDICYEDLPVGTQFSNGCEYQPDTSGGGDHAYGHRPNQTSSPCAGGSSIFFDWHEVREDCNKCDHEPGNETMLGVSGTIVNECGNPIGAGQEVRMHQSGAWDRGNSGVTDDDGYFKIVSNDNWVQDNSVDDFDFDVVVVSGETYQIKEELYFRCDPPPNTGYYACPIEYYNSDGGDWRPNFNFRKAGTCTPPRGYMAGDTTNMFNNQSRNFGYTTTDADGNLTASEMHYRSKPQGSSDSNYSGWTLLSGSDWSFFPTDTFSLENIPYTCDETSSKDVQIVVNAYDETGLMCTGNPVVSDPWYDCFGDAAWPDHKEFVCGPSPTAIPTPKPTSEEFPGQCTGSKPDNTDVCPGDEDDLNFDLAWTRVTDSFECNVLPKCQYYCTPPRIWDGDSCELPVVSGCDLNLAPSSDTIDVGDNTLLLATVSDHDSVGIDRVEFTRIAGSSVTPISRTDSSPAFTSSYSGDSEGTSTIRATAFLDNGEDCDDTATITVGVPITDEPTPVPTSADESCTASFDQSLIEGSIVGETYYLTLTVSDISNPVDEVDFRSDSDVDHSPNDDSSVPYEVEAYIKSATGDGYVWADVYINSEKACDAQVKFNDIEAPTPICNVFLTIDDEGRGEVGEDVLVTAMVISDEDIDRVIFESTDEDVARVNPEEVDELPFRTFVKGRKPGQTTITAEAYANGVVCNANAEVNYKKLFTVEDNECEVKIEPSEAELDIGTSQVFNANVYDLVGEVDEVQFSVSDIDPWSNVLSIVDDPPIDNSDPYGVEVVGENIGKGKLKAEVIMVGGSTVVCSSDANVDPLLINNGTITVKTPDPWWQIYDGDVTAGGDIVSGAGGNITSNIPDMCIISEVCDPVLIHTETGFPGVPALGGTFSGNDVSKTRWLAEGSNFAAVTTYDYDYFKRKLSAIPEDDRNVINAINSVSAETLKTYPDKYKTYTIVEYTGVSDTFTLLGASNPLNLLPGKKVVLFVHNADLVIEADIRVVEGESFFMAIVDGDIIINPAVGGLQESPPEPDLEGIFYANGQFKTGTLGDDIDGNGLDNQLHIRGSVVGYGTGGATDGVLLERNLPDNSEVPAELFEYAPDQVLLFPRFLSSRRYEWREVAP